MRNANKVGTARCAVWTPHLQTSSIAVTSEIDDVEISMRLEPTNIQQIGDELAIAWNDGTESFLKLELLRRACPCAACGGEPDVLGQVVRPDLSHTNKSFELVGFDLVGGYALQPRWADGHSTGIYSFTYLRRLAQYSD